MDELNGLVVGIDLICSCGASVAVVADGRVLCRHCSADRGELAAEAIQFLRDTVRVFGAPGEPVMIFSAIQGKLQMKRADLFPSKFLRASDLGGKPDTVVIEVGGP